VSEREDDDPQLPNELAQLLFEHASDAIILTNAEGVVVGVNAQATALLGYSRRELLELNIMDIIPVQEQCPTHEPGSGQREMRRRDGTTVTVEVRVKQLPDGSIMGMVRDVSERARADAEIRRQKEFIERLVESTTDGIAAFDTDLVVKLFNPAMEQITGLPAADVIGKKVFEVFPFLLDVGENELIRATLRGERTEARDRTFTIPQSGRAGRYEARYSPLTDNDGAVIGAIGVIRDVTERHALEQRLLHAQKLETAGRLAGGIAHDFNNVLTVILGEVSLSLGPRWNEDKARDALRRIGESAERAASLTRQLLAFSRRTFVSPSLFRADELIDGLKLMLRHLIGEGITLKIVQHGESASIRADRGHMEQVLANLIVNARDAMPHGGALTVETHSERLAAPKPTCVEPIAPGDYVVLSVSDTGIGMSEEVKARLFEPFFTTKKNGTGLGLCSCLGMVQQSGGGIAVESAEGKGTTIRVYLPRLPTESLPYARPATSLPLGKERILVVEDEEAVRNVTTALLRNLGYTVFEADNGVMALEFIEAQRGPPELVLSDIVMPRMGGRELIERIKESWPATKVLLMTGYTDDRALHERIVSEGWPVLAKPFTESALALKIRAVLDVSAGEC
jgi:PAS domain S-box-containing protein